MTLRFRAVCECGWTDDWYKMRFVAVGEGNLHAHRDDCDDDREIEAEWAHRLGVEAL